MNTFASCSLLASSALLSVAALGCGPSADEACTHYLKLRQNEELPSDREVHEECVKDLEAAKKKLPKTGGKLMACIKNAELVEAADTCASRSAPDEEKAKARELFAEGIAPEATTAWVKKGVLDNEACQEGARAITRKKERAKIIAPGEVDKHVKDMFSACKKEKSNAIYVETFICMRKAEGEKELMACVTAPDDAAKAAVIEGCYKKCKSEHGDSSNPAYMPCFTGCRTARGF
jgi:hypothetical protein